MEFFQALKTQGRVISALTLRETRSRYGNSRLGFFWALFEPFAHIIVFIGIFSALGRATPIGENMGLFILTGIIPWLLYSNTVGKIMSGLSSNKSLLGYPQVMPLDITISRLILEFSTLLLVMLFFLGVASFMGTSIRIDSFLEVLKATGLILLLASGVGMINGAIVPHYPSYSSIFRAFSRPLYFISGVFFTASFLSPEVYAFIDFNPMLHLIEWFRSGFYPNFDSDLYDADYAVYVCVSIFAIGLFIERISSKRARQI